LYSIALAAILQTRTHERLYSVARSLDARAAVSMLECRPKEGRTMPKGTEKRDRKNKPKLSTKEKKKKKKEKALAKQQKQYQV
jgi:hypothetical protein